MPAPLTGNKTALMLVCCGFLATYLFLFVSQGSGTHMTAKIGKVPRDQIGKEEVWIREIELRGPTVAYQELSAYLKNVDPGVQHGLAHVFGGALYKTTGMSGFTTCDSQFSYGCFHEFIGRAIEERGLSVVSALNASCLTMEGAPGCQHGIGHGVLGYIGYDESDLFKTLALCDSLEKNDPVRGCNSGAFMEYNLRSMVGGPDEIRKPDAISKTAYTEPCTTVVAATGNAQLDSRNMESCVYVLPQWWWTLNEGSGDSTATDTVTRRVALMGERCMTFKDKALIQSCFEGIGQTSAAASGYEPLEAVRLCREISKDPELVRSCEFIAAATFHNVGAIEQAHEVCAALPSETQRACEQSVNGNTDIPIQ